MEKKNNGIVILLVILVVGLSGYILYDKDILGLKGEKNESNTSTVNDSSNKKDESIEIGSVGNKESKIKLEIDDNLYFYIKDGKVVFHKLDGTEIVDSTIPDKVIQIAKGFSCDGGDARLAALTDKGEVYYNKYGALESISKNDYNYKFDFIKVIAEEKVYGIDSIQPNIIYTCSYTEFFAYINKDDMKIINPYIDNDIYLKKISERKVVSASLGKTYNELYPYKDYIISNLDMPFLYETKEGKLYFEKTSINPIANENMYLTINSNYIYSDEIYIRETNNQNEYQYYIIDKNKKLYIMTVSPTNNNNYYKYTYTIKNTGKIVKNIKSEKQEGKNNKVTLEYTDGTSEEI